MYKLQYSKQRRQNMPEICRFRFCPNAAQTVMWTFVLTISRPVVLGSLLDQLERECEVWSGILKTTASYVGHKIGIVRAPLRYLRPKGDIDILFSFNAGLRASFKAANRRNVTRLDKSFLALKASSHYPFLHAISSLFFCCGTGRVHAPCLRLGTSSRVIRPACHDARRSLSLAGCW